MHLVLFCYKNISRYTVLSECQIFKFWHDNFLTSIFGRVLIMCVFLDKQNCKVGWDQAEINY